MLSGNALCHTQKHAWISTVTLNPVNLALRRKHPSMNGWELQGLAQCLHPEEVEAWGSRKVWSVSNRDWSKLEPAFTEDKAYEIAPTWLAWISLVAQLEATIFHRLLIEVRPGTAEQSMLMWEHHEGPSFQVPTRRMRSRSVHLQCALQLTATPRNGNSRLCLLTRQRGLQQVWEPRTKGRGKPMRRPELSWKLME